MNDNIKNMLICLIPILSIYLIVENIKTRSEKTQVIVAETINHEQGIAINVPSDITKISEEKPLQAAVCMMADATIVYLAVEAIQRNSIYESQRFNSDNSVSITDYHHEN